MSSTNQAHATSKPNIVHEADVQRQHMRLQVPLQLELGGQLYSIKNWSNGGFAVADLEQQLVVGETMKGILVFPFDAARFQLDVEFEVRNVVELDKMTGCRFVNLTERQMSVIQFAVSAYIAGDIVQMGDVLDVMSRDSFTTERKVPSPTAGLSPKQLAIFRLRQGLRYGMLGVFGLLLLGYIATSLYERAYVVRPLVASLQTDIVNLLSPRDGQIFFSYGLREGQSVITGQPLYMLTTDLDRTIQVNSPCDCTITKMATVDKEWVRSEEPLFVLQQNGAPFFVEASVRYHDSLSLQVGDHAALSLAETGSSIIDGEVSNISVDMEASLATVKIDFASSEELKNKIINVPVEVKINTFRWAR